jgi:hypothetical protein
MGRYIRLQSDYFDLLLDYDENRHSISKNGLDTLYNVLIFLGRKAVFEPEDAHSPSERIHAYALQEFFKELKY